MKHQIIVLTSILFLITEISVAQNISINTTGAVANSSSLLEVGNGSPTTGGDTKGLLIPRVALTSATDAATIASPATSLMVWNSGSAGLTPAGYYYWDGAKWVMVANATTGGSSTTGCGDACTWTLVAVANSTAGGTGNVSSGYTVPAGKEVLAVLLETGASIIVATTDAVSVFEINSNISSSSNDVVVSLHSPNLNVSTLTAVDGNDMVFAKIKGRFNGSASAAAIRISPLSVIGDYILIDGTGLIYLYDAVAFRDASLYIFAR